MKEVRDFFNRERVRYYADHGIMLTDKEMSELIGAPPTTFSSWVNSKRGKPSIQYLPKIAEVFSFEIYEIVGEPRPTPVMSTAGLLPEVVEVLEEARLKIIESGKSSDLAASLDTIRETLKKVSATSISKR